MCLVNGCRASVARQGAMKSVAANSIIRWTLTVWMLWVSAFAIPPIVHRHEGGDRPHQHGPSDGDHVEKSQLPDVDTPVNGHAIATIFPSADLHLHSGILLPGAIGHRLAPSELGRSSGPTSCGWETGLTAIATFTGSRVSWLGGVWAHIELWPPPGLFVLQACQSDRFEELSSTAPAHSFLCDRARHERSGVLLA